MRAGDRAALRRPGRRAAALQALLALVALLALTALLTPVRASAAEGGTDGDPSPDPVPSLPPAGAPWFGPDLDWEADDAASYADRLGRTPSLYSQRVHYPLTDTDVTYLEQFVEQAAAQGAVPVVNLEPQVGLDELTADDAEALADELADLHVRLDVFTLVRFAPEMNGSWVTWGQQPEAYVAAFRGVARAVHDATDQAAMVWAPAYGASYPYGSAYGEVKPSAPRESSQLDTDRDGDVDDADDPYGPYWPGAEAVDWVGLSLYRFGAEQPYGDNTAPEDGEYEARLDETWGYLTPADREPFYDRFAVAEDLPMLVETSALYNPAADPGPGELDLKQAWWRQVFAANDEHPLVRGITWLELTRAEDEVDGDEVTWEATDPEPLAEALGDDVDAAGLTLGPVTRVLDEEAGAEATAQGRLPDDVGGAMGWVVLCVAICAVGYLAAGVVGRAVPSWRYPDDGSGRDHRLDLVRGWVIITVVVTHVEVAGVWSYVALNAVGAITGAEMFVFLSGLVLGMVYAPALARAGEWGTAVAMWKRARKQYLTALAVVLLVPLLGLVPGVDTEAVTTFVDRGTGGGGAADAGQVYDLYPNLDRLLEYPPPWFAVKGLLLLEMGPWVFNIMGLFIVLSLVLPLCMALVRRRLWWLLLAVSWVLYLLEARYEWHPLPSQFEYVFPLLSWQLLFTHGLVLGWYRARVVRALTTRAGKAAVGVLVALYATVLVYLWACHRAEVDPLLLPAGSYDWLYDHAYNRVYLQPGRLVDLVLVVVSAYAVLTTCWKPIDRALGWFWTPMGVNSLYVFVVHVFFAVAVASLPFLDRGAFWQGTIIHTVVVLLIWAMVRKRVLFSVIPR